VNALCPLQAIVDVDVAAAAGWQPEALTRAYLEGGARLLQLRAKQMSSGPLLDLCDTLVSLGAQCGAALLVNDRADLARLSRAAGVHVGQDDLPPSAARALVGPTAIVGCSTHTLAQVEATLEEPVTYVAVGPVFGTRTKETGYAPVGLAFVREAARRSGGRPIVAIGGITLDTAPAVLAAGAACVAVITDLLAGDPAVRVADYLRRLAP
jgi:thiamine-phosphate pyrophosphorylase